MTRLFFHRYSNRRSLWDLIPPSAPTEAEGLGSESGPRPTATFLSENSRDPQPPNAQHGRHRHHREKQHRAEPGAHDQARPDGQRLQGTPRQRGIRRADIISTPGERSPPDSSCLSAAGMMRLRTRQVVCSFAPRRHSGGFHQPPPSAWKSAAVSAKRFACDCTRVISAC